jgi:hypothetical protein
MDHSKELLLVFAGVLGTGIVGLIVKIIFDWLNRPKYQTENGKPMLYMKCPLDRANAIENINWIKENYGKEMSEYAKVSDDVTWLKEIHNARDKDGVPLWYVPRSIEKTMDRVAISTEKQNITLEKIAGLLSLNGAKLDTLIKNGNGKK